MKILKTRGDNKRRKHRFNQKMCAISCAKQKKSVDKFAESWYRNFARKLEWNAGNNRLLFWMAAKAVEGIRPAEGIFYAGRQFRKEGFVDEM